MIIDGGVYLCIYTVYSNVLKQHTQHTFVYDSYFSTKDRSAFRCAIIDNRTYAPMFVLVETDRSNKDTMKNMLRKIFDGNCVVKYAFKVTSQDSP